MLATLSGDFISVSLSRISIFLFLTIDLFLRLLIIDHDVLFLLSEFKIWPLKKDFFVFSTNLLCSALFFYSNVLGVDAFFVGYIDLSV